MDTTQILDAVGDPFAPGGYMYALFDFLGPLGSICLFIGLCAALMALIPIFFDDDPMRFFWP